MTTLFYIIFKLLNLILLLLFIMWVLYVHISYRLKKGDKVMWPPHKKTSYKNGIISDYDFKPFFNKIKENMEENKKIKYYKWIYYYDENVNYFSKVELVCYYHIGRRRIWVFESSQMFYEDQTGTHHLSIDLIIARHSENLLAGDLYKTKTYYWKKDTNFKELKNKNNQLIGYNILTGHLQYEIILEQN